MEHNVNNFDSTPSPNTNSKPRILCVDDEPNILSSLRRLFRANNYDVLIANSGSEGLLLLETEPVDLIISDMRMPIMSGAVFLEKVRTKWPDSMRLLLTGYADIQSIISAINSGEIYRYITKPWDDADILLIVRQALERKELEKEKIRLEKKTAQQNEELRLLNESLEQRVQQRTKELKGAHDLLMNANEKLRNSFLTSIKVFANVIEMRSGNLVGQSREVADLARKIAKQLRLDGRTIQDIFVASLLASIGKIGFSDDLIKTPICQLDAEQLGEFYKHTKRSEQLLMPLDDLQVAAKIIKAQHERYDGCGLPDGLSGEDIPIGARILTVANDYFQLQHGMINAKRLSIEEAKHFISKGAGSRYDVKVVKAFEEVFDTKKIEQQYEEVRVNDLQPGMVLATDLISKDGMLLLPVDFVLTQGIVDKLKSYDRLREEKMNAKIYREWRK